MKLGNLALLPKKKPKKKVAKENPRIQRELFQRKNIAKPFTFTGKSEVPITGIAPTGYAGGGLGGPGVNADNVREFLTELDAFEKEFGYGKKEETEGISSLKNIHKPFYGLVPNDPKKKFYYGVKNEKYYGYAQPKIPENNRGEVIDGIFYPLDEGSLSNGYYQRQMAGNEGKNFQAPRVKANNERPEDEKLDPRIIETANMILQQQEKMKQRVRDKYRKNNVAFRKKHETVQKNIELEQVFDTIEEQQNMIIDLVNNVVTDRERELKKRNAMLRMRIENLERSITLEEAQRQEMMQNFPMVPILKNPQKKVHYEDDSDDSDDSDEDDDDSDDDQDDDSDSDSESDMENYVPKFHTPRGNSIAYAPPAANYNHRAPMYPGNKSHRLVMREKVLQPKERAELRRQKKQEKQRMFAFNQAENEKIENKSAVYNELRRLYPQGDLAKTREERNFRKNTPVENINREQVQRREDLYPKIKGVPRVPFRPSHVSNPDGDGSSDSSSTHQETTGSIAASNKEDWTKE
ncbi:unnamed protein product [Moneuplotes crassus]|uniref:Uncharacterized protein n=1 Tax=Euplotes crassus TaxID=5936 RepID=A0AAD1UA16_EUPCR|nr:unnamed protein product [Moneuplotes crassus]